VALTGVAGVVNGFPDEAVGLRSGGDRHQVDRVRPQGPWGTHQRHP
jgi:hypothetical protein